MTIDEAISHAEEVAEQNETQADKIGRQLIGSAIDKYATDCRECASDHIQLVEWLRELKDLREKNKVLTSECDRLNKLKEKSVLDICRREARLREAKRLLKSAIDEWHIVCEWGNCGEYCGWYVNGQCSQKWSGEAEALKLIGETNDEP